MALCASKCAKCELLKGKQGACPFGCDQNCDCYKPQSDWKCRDAACDHCNCPEIEGGCKCDNECRCRPPTLLPPPIHTIVTINTSTSSEEHQGNGCDLQTCKIPIIVATITFAGSIVAAVVGVAWSRRRGQMADGLNSGFSQDAGSSSFAPSSQSNPPQTSNGSSASTAGSKDCLLGSNPLSGLDVSKSKTAGPSACLQGDPSPAYVLDYQNSRDAGGDM